MCDQDWDPGSSHYDGVTAEARLPPRRCGLREKIFSSSRVATEERFRGAHPGETLNAGGPGPASRNPMRDKPASARPARCAVRHAYPSKGASRFSSLPKEGVRGCGGGTAPQPTLPQLR